MDIPQEKITQELFDEVYNRLKPFQKDEKIFCRRPVPGGETEYYPCYQHKNVMVQFTQKGVGDSVALFYKTREHREYKAEPTKWTHRVFGRKKVVVEENYTALAVDDEFPVVDEILETVAQIEDIYPCKAREREAARVKALRDAIGTRDDADTKELLHLRKS